MSYIASHIKTPGIQHNLFIEDDATFDSSAESASASTQSCSLRRFYVCVCVCRFLHSLAAAGSSGRNAGFRIWDHVHGYQHASVSPHTLRRTRLKENKPEMKGVKTRRETKIKLSIREPTCSIHELPAAVWCCLYGYIRHHEYENNVQHTNVGFVTYWSPHKPSGVGRFVSIISVHRSLPKLTDHTRHLVPVMEALCLMVKHEINI